MEPCPLEGLFVDIPETESSNQSLNDSLGNVIETYVRSGHDSVDERHLF